MLPYILSELRDLSSDREEAPRHVVQGYGGDVDLADLLEELLLCRPRSTSARTARPARPAFRPGVVRLIDATPEPQGLQRRRQSYPGRPSILQQLRRELGELVHTDDAQNAFAVNVDVQDYRPEELSVQVTKDDGYVVVEGCHEERSDEHGVGLVRRQFTRRYKLPAGVDPDTITSRLTPEGVLQVSAPVKALHAPQDKVRQVPITWSKQPTQPVLQKHAEEDEQALSQAHAENGEEAKKTDSKEDKPAQVDTSRVM